MRTRRSLRNQDRLWRALGNEKPPVPNPKNCQEIIIAYLRANGYDGLGTTDCGCGIDDLIPCSEDFSRCRPAKKEGDIWITK